MQEDILPIGREGITDICQPKGAHLLGTLAFVTFPGRVPEHQGRKRTCRRQVTCSPAMGLAKQRMEEWNGRRMEGHARRESKRMMKVHGDS